MLAARQKVQTLESTANAKRQATRVSSATTPSSVSGLRNSRTPKAGAAQSAEHKASSASPAAAHYPYLPVDVDPAIVATKLQAENTLLGQVIVGLQRERDVSAATYFSAVSFVSCNCALSGYGEKHAGAETSTPSDAS